ncbi:protein-tyrosine phosphatase family protein [Actinomycetospora termitidis]|uniref:Protein-tyrosine phosphatase family protein n=1 Tax=Actinomycetospora termitidis TaxID=3053470 RepID=A0ABT7MAT9_9PSEU|nr:protein-tyrosine phosphatase family protein [Actinomycetospora sp. Odt1-22]MDL5156538.1 protein-tyrosine phosphatase family protein [Actinomycetospora sp. Odt1-22]
MYGAPLTLPDGRTVRARGLRSGPPPEAPAFGLYLGSERAARRHDPALIWPHRWLVWPDFRTPRHPDEARTAIEALHARAASEVVEVACGGGIGRTGTVLACLATLDGLGPDEAVAWVRAHHHRRAVETPGQRRWVRWFAEQPR